MGTVIVRDSLQGPQSPLTPERKQLVNDYIRDWKTPIKYLRARHARKVSAARALGVTLDDIEQQALFYLLRAANLYDFERGASFPTFAHWHVMASLSSLITKMTQKTAAPVGRVASLDAVLDPKDGNTLAHVLGKDDQPGDLDRNDLPAAYRDAVAALPPRWRTILELRFGFDDEPKTLREIGQALHMSKERVRQIETKAKERVRDAVSGTAAERELLEACSA